MRSPNNVKVVLEHRSYQILQKQIIFGELSFYFPTLVLKKTNLRKIEFQTSVQG